MFERQLPLFPNETAAPVLKYPFPSTRFQGSKRKFASWIWESTSDLEFESVLDVFGGTGAVSHRFKMGGKTVVYNDKLAFNWNIGLALIENSGVTFSEYDLETVLSTHPSVNYPDFIQTTFQGIFFNNEENVWLDHIVYNIDHFLEHPLKRALARFALFQACIIKRPYNLFHRANLYMREANVKRSFGNKATWDAPFEKHFRTFVREANAAVFDNHAANQALHLDAFDTPVGADLVYLDPPYLNSRGVGVDYREFYHFLEGIVNYDTWGNMIDFKSKHRRLMPEENTWNQSKTILQAFENIIERHRSSILVISYRDDGIPSKVELMRLLRKYKSHIREAAQSQKYVLSKRDSHELLLIAE